MDRQSCPEFRKLRVLIVGQRDSFAHILAANIQCWGHEVMVLPSEKVMCVEGDVLLYDLDESLRISTLTRGRDMPTLNMSLPSGFAGEDVKSCREQLPRARLTIALSSFSVSRTTLERIGAVALLQKPFEMSHLQHYLRILRRLLLEGEEAQQPGNKLRILVVDDDVTIANVVRDSLNFESRYEVAVAYDGLEALEQSFRWKPHCIVTDLIMPWMNGYQVIHCLAASSLQRMPSFVIMSALAQLEVPVNRSYLRGKVVAYVNKPFSIDHLLTAIKQVCMESV
ncbi:MAG: response regulator [Ktedonobacteraceae bacterium]